MPSNAKTIAALKRVKQYLRLQERAALGHGDLERADYYARGWYRVDLVHQWEDASLMQPARETLRTLVNHHPGHLRGNE